MAGKKQKKIGKRINLYLPPEHAEKLAAIRQEVGLDDTNTLRHLIVVYELKQKL